jgi:hypothetical protein
MDTLSATVDTVNEVFFFGRPLSASDRVAAAEWIAGRQGLPGSYGGMFAPTERDFRDGVTTFTGEHQSSRAGTAHLLGEEACRALILLNVPAAQPALGKATADMIECLNVSERRGYAIGTFCCGMCSCAYWRHLAVGGLDRQEERLSGGMKVLKSRRLNNGRWRSFPFWYALLALTGMDVPGVESERQFAAPVCERYLRRPPAGEYAARRRRVAELVLEQV